MDAMVISQNPAKEDQEILNALRADGFVYEQYEDGADLDARMIREINRQLLDTLKEGGEFRRIQVEISGASFQPPAPPDIAPLIDDILRGYRDAAFLHPVIQAAWVHHQISFVHPFIDGNGRTARLIQDFVLLKRGLYPIGVPSSQRDEYYQALQKADAGDWDDIVALLAQNQLNTLGKIDAITRAPDERMKWITNLTKLASTKKTGALRKQYVVWKSRMEQIRDAFARAASEIDEASEVIGAAYRWYETIDFDSWKSAVTTGRHPAFNWSISLLFFIDGDPVYKLIGYFARHKSNPDDFVIDMKEVVSMHFTGIPAKSDERLDYTNYNDPHIRLRELLYHNDKLHAFVEKNGVRDCIDDASIEEVVRDLFEDVFYRKGGLGG